MRSEAPNRVTYEVENYPDLTKRLNTVAFNNFKYDMFRWSKEERNKMARALEEWKSL